MPRRQRTDRQLTNLAHRIHNAATLLPTIHDQLIQQLAYLDNTPPNETGPTAGGELNDPVLRAVMARAAITNRKTALDQAKHNLETAVTALDHALRAARTHNPPAEHPICYHADCHDPVSSWKRTDGSIAYRMSGEHPGLCDRHRMQAIRNRT